MIPESASELKTLSVMFHPNAHGVLHRYKLSCVGLPTLLLRICIFSWYYTCIDLCLSLKSVKHRFDLVITSFIPLGDCVVILQ